jgi:hypothetical protein
MIAARFSSSAAHPHFAKHRQSLSGDYCSQYFPYKWGQVGRGSGKGWVRMLFLPGPLEPGVPFEAYGDRAVVAESCRLAKLYEPTDDGLYIDPLLPPR